MSYVHFVIITTSLISISSLITKSFFVISCRDLSIQTMVTRKLQRTLNKPGRYVPVKFNKGCLYIQHETNKYIESNAKGFTQRMLLKYDGKISNYN